MFTAIIIYLINCGCDEILCDLKYYLTIYLKVKLISGAAIAR